MTVSLPLGGSRGASLVTTIDDADETVVSGRALSLHSEGYVQISLYPSPPALLHRLLLGAPKGALVDHRNGDRLDNQRSNIRLCGSAGNARNRAGVHQRVWPCEFKGVRWFPRDSRWQARITVDRIEHHLGYFDDPAVAARVYDEAAHRYFGEFARPNFPLEVRCG